MAINPQEDLLERVNVVKEGLLERGRGPEKKSARERDHCGAPSVRKKKVSFSDASETLMVASESSRRNEPMMKGAHTSYTTKEKKTQQGELFPELEKESKKAREER